MSFLDPLATYPGQTEDEPIAIVCGEVFQENRGKDKERQGKDGKRRRRDEGRRREDSETQLRETRPVDGEREWRPEINEVNHALLRRFKVTPTRGMSTLIIIRVALIQFLQISSRFTFIYARVAYVENGRDSVYRRNQDELKIQDPLRMQYIIFLVHCDRRGLTGMTRTLRNLQISLEAIFMSDARNMSPEILINPLYASRPCYPHNDSVINLALNSVTLAAARRKTDVRHSKGYVR